MKSFRSEACFLVLGVMLSVAQLASAQDWPRHAVRLVVGYPAGGALDIMAREIAQRLADRWRQPVVVDNRPGAGEIVATASVIRSIPDGHTLLFSSEIQQTNPILFPKLPYDPRTDLTPITRVAEGSFVYVVRRESPYQSFQQLVAAARARPGKISFGSGGAGGASHVAVTWFASKAGLEFQHIPYKGASDRLLGLLAGHIDFTAVPLSAISEMLRERRLRALATSGVDRLQSLPAVPTLTELGYKDAVVTTMFALFGPARMAPNLASQIAGDVTAVTRDPKFKAEKLDPFGLVVVGDTPAEFAAFLVADQENQRARIKSTNVKVD